MNNDAELFKLEKSIWTHDDFEIMGWHDANIYGILIETREGTWAADFLLDLDYIFKWVNPVAPSEYFTFHVAPCTMVFKEVFDLKIDFDTSGSGLDLMEIADLQLKSKTEQEKSIFVYDWTIELQQGEISLKSYGLEQIVRQHPIHVPRQILTLEERGGINFSRKAYDRE